MTTPLRSALAAAGVLVTLALPARSSLGVEPFASIRAPRLTPLEAIQVGTDNGARILGVDGQTGSLDAGKAADLLVVDGDPARDSSGRSTRAIVFKDGTGYDSRKLVDSVKGTVGIQ